MIDPFLDFFDRMNSGRICLPVLGGFLSGALGSLARFHLPEVTAGIPNLTIRHTDVWDAQRHQDSMGRQLRKIRRNLCSSAFTLLEMLVGIAIVCVLGALLFPLVSKMRASGLAARCTSNLRQLGALFQAQAAENNGVIQLFYFHDANPHAMIRWSDYLVNEHYLDANNKISSCPVNFSQEEGRVYGIVKQDFVNDPYSFSIDGADGSRAVHLNTIEQPSKYWLLTDSWSIGDQKQIWFVRNTNPNAQMHMRHHGKANILFADGHVAAFRVQETKDFTINPITTAADEAGKRVIYP